MCRPHVGLVEVATPNARLIGDDDDDQAGVVELPNGLRRPRQQVDLRHVAEVADVLDDRAIPIQKYRGSRHLGSEGGSDKARRTAFNTGSGDRPFMQRWSIGHSRSMQGRHHTGLISTSARPPARVSGAVSISRVGPNSATIGVPIAPARCIAPESFETQAADAASTPARACNEVCPARSIGCTALTTSSAVIMRIVSASPPLPTSTVLTPWCEARVRITCAKCRGSHRLAVPYAAPGAIVTRGCAPSHPHALS